MPSHPRPDLSRARPFPRHAHWPGARPPSRPPTLNLLDRGVGHSAHLSLRLAGLWVRRDTRDSPPQRRGSRLKRRRTLSFINMRSAVSEFTLPGGTRKLIVNVLYLQHSRLHIFVSPFFHTIFGLPRERLIRAGVSVFIKRRGCQLIIAHQSGNGAHNGAGDNTTEAAWSEGTAGPTRFTARGSFTLPPPPALPLLTLRFGETRKRFGL